MPREQLFPMSQDKFGAGNIDPVVPNLGSASYSLLPHDNNAQRHLAIGQGDKCITG